MTYTTPGAIDLADMDRDDRRRLAAVARIAPKKDAARPVLASVMFDHRGVWATGGAHLGFLPARTGLASGERVIVNARRVIQATGQATRKDHRLEVRFGDAASSWTVTEPREDATHGIRDLVVRLTIPIGDASAFPMVDTVLGIDPGAEFFGDADAARERAHAHWEAGRYAFDTRLLSDLAALSPAPFAPTVALVPRTDGPSHLANRQHYAYDADGRFLGAVMVYLPTYSRPRL